MRYELITHNGIPAWRYADGTVLPVMAGGQEGADAAALAALQALLGGQEGSLLEVAGREFVHVGTGRSGVLRWRQASDAERRQGHDVGGKVFYLESAGGTQFLSGRGGYSLMDSLRNVVMVGHGGVTRSGGKASEADIDRMFPSGAGGAGAAPPAWRPGELELEQQALEQRLQELQMSFDNETAQAVTAHENAIRLLGLELASASELQKERIQAEIDLENLTHENNLAELEIRIEGERKNIIYGEIGATGRTMLQEQGAMKRELLGLGPDPFAQAAGLSGQVTRGITPQQQAVGQAQAFINQPIPQVNFDMPLPQMEGILAGIQGTQPPSFGGFGISGGMAKGGTVKTKKQQSVIVGEAGKEIVTGSDFKVTPLAGTAQFGARIGGIGTRSTGGIHVGEGPLVRPHVEEGPLVRPPPVVPPPPPLDQGPYPNPLVESILQGLAPMYAGSAFGQVPVRAGDPRWGPTYFQGQPGLGSPLSYASELGIAPQLIRTAAYGEPGLDPRFPNAYGHTYFIDEQGRRNIIPNGNDPDVLRSLGFDPRQVVMVAPSDVKKYPPGTLFTGQGAQAAGAVSGQTGYGALGAPLIEQTSGALLMAPKKIAGNWWGMSPIEQQVMLSAYQHAGGPTGFGIGPQNVLDRIQTFTPAGRGYGRRIGGIGGQF